MTKIITVNVNGIRSAAKKGLFSWLGEQNADVVCFQEVRAFPEQFPLEEEDFRIKHNYFRELSSAVKPGYAGVATYSRLKPLSVTKDHVTGVLGNEGRVLITDFGSLRVANLYFPSGTSGESRQAEKYRFMSEIETFMIEDLKKNQDSRTLYVGDWNIAHTKNDIKNWQSNQKNSGFLPEERAWMDKMIGEHGFIDAFRSLIDRTDEYSWWSNRGRARENNVGWRIDYQLATPAFAGKIKEALIYRDSFFSDHAPVIIDYDL